MASGTWRLLYLEHWLLYCLCLLFASVGEDGRKNGKLSFRLKCQLL